MESRTSNGPSWLENPATGRWLIVLALAIRIAFFLIFDLRDMSLRHPFSGDATEYTVAAARMLDGAELEPYWPPGVPIYVAVWGIFGEIPGNGLLLKLAMLPWFVLLIVGSRYVATQLFNHSVANLSVLFLALYPDFIHQSLTPLSHLPAAALFMTMLAALLRARERTDLVWWMVAGISLGMLLLFRPAAGILIPGLLIWLVFREKQRAKAVIFTISAAILPLIWIIHVHSATGRWVYINDANARNFFLGNNAYTDNFATWKQGSVYASAFGEDFRQLLDSLDRLPETEKGAAFRKAGAKHIQKKPGQFFIRLANRGIAFLAPDTFSAGYMMGHYKSFSGRIVFFVVGWLLYTVLIAGWLRGVLAKGFWKPERRIYLILLVLYAIPYLLAFSHPVYHLPILPLIAMFAFYGLTTKINLEKSLPNQRILAIFLALLFIVVEIRWMYYLISERTNGML